MVFSPMNFGDGQPTTGTGGQGSPGGGGVVVGTVGDLSVKLTPDGNSLILLLTPGPGQQFSSLLTYSIYWLSPLIFSQADVAQNYGGPGGIAGTGTSYGVSIIQGRQKVVDLNGGSGPIQTVVPYVPYDTGGWMYATIVPVSGGKEYRLAGTNFVPVPGYNALTGSPLSAEAPNSLQLQVTDIGVDPKNRLVQVAWRNAGTLTSVAYVKIVALNYWNDGFYRDIVTFRVNTRPGAVQGSISQSGANSSAAQSFILEADSSVGAHNITWYFQPLTSAFVPLAIGSCPSIVSGAIS